MQNMQSATQSQTCVQCSCSPFCMMENKHLQRTKHLHATVKRQRVFKRRETVCLPKNKFQNLYVIQRGALKTYQTDADGNELIRGFYFAGELLGCEAIYTDYYPFSVVALSETVVCEIPYDNLLSFLESKPALQKHMFYLISKQLNSGSYLVATAALQRLAAFLLDLSTRLHPPHTQLTFSLPMSHQDIGNYLRLTPETISRLFSQLQKDGIIMMCRKQICLLRVEALKQMANDFGGY